MSSEAKEVVRRFCEEYEEKRDPAALAEFLAPDVIDHTPMPGMPEGAERVRIIFESLWSALPDMRVEIHDQIAEDDKVVTRKSFVGTHRGELIGVPATGKEIHIDLIDILRVRDRKIVEHWNIIDTYGLMQQLGVLPSGPRHEPESARSNT